MLLLFGINYIKKGPYKDLFHTQKKMYAIYLVVFFYFILKINICASFFDSFYCYMYLKCVRILWSTIMCPYKYASKISIDL